MAVSTIPAVKQKLIDLFTASPALADVKITWTYPVDENDIGTEHIHFGDVEQTEEWRWIGKKDREEDYQLPLIVLAKVYGRDPAAADARIWTLREAVAGILRTDPTLGGILNEDAEIAATTIAIAPLTDAWSARAQLTLHCRAFI